MKWQNVDKLCAEYKQVTQKSKIEFKVQIILVVKREDEPINCK